MIDLADIHLIWLARYVRKTRDVAPLVAHLDSDGAITPELRVLLAGFLAGQIKATRKRNLASDANWPGLLKAERDFWKAELLFHAHIGRHRAPAFEPAYEDFEEIQEVLDQAGYSGFPATRGECREAAEKIVGWHNSLTPSQLDALLRPRARSEKGV